MSVRQMMMGRKPAGGGGAFSPLDIAWHTAFWAEDPSWTAPADGGAVSQWDDASGNGRHASQATATNQPTYRASVTALNSKPALEFDRSNDYLQTASFGSAVAQPNTIVVVAKRVNDTSSMYLFDSASSSNRQLLLTSSTGGSGWAIFAGSELNASVADDTNPHLWVATFDATDTLEQDGTSVASGSAGANALGGLTIGARYSGATHFGGEIAFFGLLNRALTSGERSDIESWAASHYGLTIA